MKKAIVVILVLLLLSVTGCSFSITTANISEPIMTAAIQNGEPVDEVVEYT